LFGVKKANFFAKFFGENIFTITTAVPGHCRTQVNDYYSLGAREKFLPGGIFI
jgi:hypothetical protein